MKLSHTLLALLWAFAVTVEAQTHCYDDGLTLTCTGDDTVHLMRMPDGSGITGYVDGKPWTLMTPAPGGLRPLPQLPAPGTMGNYPPSPAQPRYWNY